MHSTVEVRFKGIRKEYFRWPADGGPLHPRDAVVVQVERGLDLGRVSTVGDTAAKKCGGCSGCGPVAGAAEPPALPPVVRLATPDDVQQAEDLRRSEDAVRLRVTERVRSHGLPMRISDTEWQWDRKKLTVYFTAEQRVDFRALVRELAAQYRTRIELRQIGARDEAARLGGVGRCGREFCCSTWLTDLPPVSLSLAKDQHLSLNPAQISGGCGRLLCCLRYEHEFYVAARKRFPKEGKTLGTARGTEKVVAVDILRERVLLRGEEGSRTVALVDLKSEIEALGETLVVAGVRPRAEPAAPTPPSTPADAAPAPTAEAIEADATKRRRRRRRRRRGGGSTGSDESPPGGEA